MKGLCCMYPVCYSLYTSEVPCCAAVTVKCQADIHFFSNRECCPVDEVDSGDKGKETVLLLYSEFFVIQVNEFIRLP